MGKAISRLNNCCRPRGAVSVNEDGNILVRIEYPKGDDKLHAVDLKRDFQILASVIEGMALPIIVGADDHRKVNIVDLAKIGGLLIVIINRYVCKKISSERLYKLYDNRSQ